MPERLAYHMFRMTDWGSVAEMIARFSRFSVIICHPDLSAAQVATLKQIFPNTYIGAAEVNAMRVSIRSDGSLPEWDYEREILRTFPLAALWRNVCSGALVSDGGPFVTNYTITDAVIAWWKERARTMIGKGWHLLYTDDSPATVPAWLVEQRKDLGHIDGNGDGRVDDADVLASIYGQKIGPLTAALRAAWPSPAPLIANTGTPRVDGNLQGITIEISGIGAPLAGAAFREQLRVSRTPRICVAWCKTAEELGEWREVQASDPALRNVYVGQESGGIEIEAA